MTLEIGVDDREQLSLVTKRELLELSTTAMYTRVSIRHLKAVHDATHTATKLAPAERRPVGQERPRQ